MGFCLLYLFIINKVVVLIFFEIFFFILVYFGNVDKFCFLWFFLKDLKYFVIKFIKCKVILKILIRIMFYV